MSTRALTNEEREVIERQQFQPLPQNGIDAKAFQKLQENTSSYDAPWSKEYSSEREKLTAPYPDPGGKLVLRNWVSLVTQNNTSPGNRDLHWAVDEPVIEHYFDFICRYKNNPTNKKVEQQKQDGRQRRESLKTMKTMTMTAPHKRSQSPRQELTRRSSKRIRDGRARDRNMSPPQPEPHLSVIYIKSSTFKNIIKGDETMEAGFRAFLNDARSTPSRILEMDYLFIPYYDEHMHHVLMGIAPKQGFVFIINSVEIDYSREEQPAKGLMALALMLCPETQAWPLYGQWAEKDAQDGSPNCARQGDFHSCGIFTSTNMMCLAFGYRLMCYRNRDMHAKRVRMAAELLKGGFGPEPFDYTLLDIPTDITDYRTNYQYEPPSAPITAPQSPTVFGLSDSKQVSNSNSITSTSTTPRRNPAPSTRVPFTLVPKDDPPESEPASGDEGADPSEIDEKWPSQFGCKSYRKAGFVYKVPTNIAEAHLVSKESIVKACQHYGIRGWEAWYREPLYLFRRWFQNEVAGHMSSLKPMGYGQNLQARQREFERRMKEAEAEAGGGEGGDYWARYHEVREQFLKDMGDK